MQQDYLDIPMINCKIEENSNHVEEKNVIFII